MKLFDKWKEEWWKKNSTKIFDEFADRIIELKNRCERELCETNDKWKAEREHLLIKIRNEQGELDYRLKLIEERKLEALRADNDLKTQIKMLEAKAAPSSVWAEAFTAGFNKSWEMMLPVMANGIEKLKKSIEDKAIQDTLTRMNGHDKKNH